MKTCLYILFVCLAAGVPAQNEFTKWYFGKYTGLDFMTTPPSVISHTTLNTFEGCASAADGAGNLLFYTDGITVWNQQQLVMANGTGLLGNGSTVQAALIAKQPGNSNIYYIFTLAAQGAADGLRYSLVDMSLAAGMGSVTIKNATITTPCTEQLNGTRHCNGVDLWVVTHELNSNNFRSYLLTSAGLNMTPVISGVGPAPPTFTPNNTVIGQGTIKISPNGRKLGLTYFNGSPNIETALFDFDRSTGVVSNYLSLMTGTTNCYGCEFSEDGTKFYTALSGGSPGNIFQWDLCAGSNAQILASKTTIASPAFTFGQLQLAPNGKIYLVRWATQLLSAIDNPNVAGAGCNFVPTAQSVATGTNGIGLPNFIGGAFKVLPSFTYTMNSCSTASFTAPPSPTVNLGCGASGYAVQGILWNFGQPLTGAANTSTLTNPMHDFGAPGTYTVKLIFNYQCGADTVYKNITIPGPTITVNSSSASCTTPGTAAVSVSGGTGPFTYNWMPSGQSTPSVSGLAAGIYTVTVTDASCVFTKIVAISGISAFNLVITTSGTVVCAGTNVTLLAQASGSTGPFSYSWTGGPATAGYTVTQNAAGMVTYSLNATDQNGCMAAATRQIQFLAIPSLAAQSKSICAKESTTLTASGASNYTWSPGNSTSSLTVASPTVTKVYTVTGTFTNGCSANTTATVTVFQCTSLDETRPNKGVLKIYPNPTPADLVIETGEEVEIILCDATGREIIRRKLETGTHTLNTGTLKDGIYFLKVTGRSVSSVTKIIRQE